MEAALRNNGHNEFRPCGQMMRVISMNSQRYLLTTVLITLGALPGALCRGAEPRVMLIKAPDGGIQPQAAMDGKGTLHLIYFKGRAGAGDLYYVRRHAGQRTFSAPIRVNSQPASAVATGTIRGGQIALGRGGRVLVIWNGSSKASLRGQANEFPVLFSRLNDTGSAFEPQRNLMRKTVALDGGATIAAADDGRVYVAWHGLERHSPKGEEHRRVWLAHSQDDGKTWTEERPVSPASTGACGCCAMRGFVDQHGNVYLLYRSAREQVHRDMYLLCSTDRGDTFESRKLHAWQIHGCPMSSEAFAAAGGTVYAAWETDGQVYQATIQKRKTPESGQPGAAVTGEPEPAPGQSRARKHPALAANGRKERLLVWTEGTGWQKGGDLAWQVYDVAGHPTSAHGTIPGAIPVWGLATAVANPDGTFVIVY